MEKEGMDTGVAPEGDEDITVSVVTVIYDDT